MVKEIVRDPIFLAQKSSPATAEDAEVGRDLLDTLNANAERCVGMAANMIGVSKRIIVFFHEGKAELMYNPEIIRKSGAYKTEEGCLSLSGQRETIRYEKIKLSYLNAAFQPRLKSYSGYSAQIIQHEIDHCNGVLI